MKTISRCISLLLLTLFFYTPSLTAQSLTLVDFGASASSNQFGLAGWNTQLKSANLQYSAAGNGGLLVSGDVEEFADFRGVAGSARPFSPGERIVVTWYNTSNEPIVFTARLSFDDADTPDPENLDGTWFTMRSFTDYRDTYSEIQPHSSAQTVFNITDHGVHKSDGMHSVVNINLAIEWGSTWEKQYLLCDKIELHSDADILAPASPAELAVQSTSDSKVSLRWNAAADNVAAVEYLIYRDGEIEGYSRSTDFTCVFLEPDQDYSFTVTALDAAGNESLPSPAITAHTQPFAHGGVLLQGQGFVYLGAFMAPEDFSWGGEAIAYYPDGDDGISGDADGFPGSLFFTNLNQPENGLVGEINVPAPVISVQRNPEELPLARVLFQPVNIRPGNVNNWDYVDIWRTGLEYLPAEQRLYSSWSIHYTVTEEKHASISCVDIAQMANGTRRGAWYVGQANQPPLDAAINDWLFALPQAWADAHCSGRSLVVGRCRDGGLSGLGPTLYAFAPVGNAPPAADVALPITTLLQYGPVAASDNYHFTDAIDGYKHSDDWREALWLTGGTQNAVAIIGNKALGDNWYGYHGERMRHDWVIADVPYPEFYQTDPDGKGWRAHNRQPMVILYDPADLARVASGDIAAHSPQPYAAVRLSKSLFFGAEHEIFSAAFDAERHVLFVTEFLREMEGRLIIHAWQINETATGLSAEQDFENKALQVRTFANPFHEKTTIAFVIPKSGRVNVQIFTIRGQLVATLTDQSYPAGAHEIVWHAQDRQGRRVSAGVYLCRVEFGNSIVQKKMVYVR
ncbi:MAG: T9SS type A sorting domain-containing protein [Deferribacteres bacterium]|nr:T9SS type A sorting domain-containing protein [Deferribacteres bacterium]